MKYIVLLTNGNYYKNKFKKGYETDLYEAVIDWEEWRKNKDLDHEKIKRIASYMSPKNYQKEDLQYLKQMDKADLDEALNLIQRMRKARILKRIKAKIQRGAKLARRRVANLATLTRRARRAARNLILMKITKGVPKGDLPFARRQELEKRLSMPSIARRIGTIAKRLVPTMRKKEVERKRSANLKRAGAN